MKAQLVDLVSQEVYGEWDNLTALRVALGVTALNAMDLHTMMIRFVDDAGETSVGVRLHDAVMSHASRPIVLRASTRMAIGGRRGR